MANEFNPGVGREVPKTEAVKWIEKYESQEKDKGKDTRSVFYGKDVLERILKQDKCTGISFFLGLKHSDYAQKDTVNLVLVGTREDGTLIWPEGAGEKDGDGGMVVDTGTMCPPYCTK